MSVKEPVSCGAEYICEMLPGVWEKNSRSLKSESVDSNLDALLSLMTLGKLTFLPHFLIKNNNRKLVYVTDIKLHVIEEIVTYNKTSILFLFEI